MQTEINNVKIQLGKKCVPCKCFPRNSRERKSLFSADEDIFLKTVGICLINVAKFYQTAMKLARLCAQTVEIPLNVYDRIR